jgi:hypothetical protein
MRPNRLPGWSSGAFMLAVASLLLAACTPVSLPTGALTKSTSTDPAAQSRELRVGEPAPDFALPDQNRQEVRLSSFRGKTVRSPSMSGR